MFEGIDKGLQIEEVFYFVILGGVSVMFLQDQIGNFEVGKKFDVVWVLMIMGLKFVMMLWEEGDLLRIVFEKFIMMGDDCNIVYVYVNGCWVVGVYS